MSIKVQSEASESMGSCTPKPINTQRSHIDPYISEIHKPEPFNDLDQSNSLNQLSQQKEKDPKS